MHSACLESFPEPVDHLTVVEDTIFQQDLPHANSLSPGVNTGCLLYHPVYQLGPNTALSKGDEEIQRTERSPLCRESGRQSLRGEPSEKRGPMRGVKAKKCYRIYSPRFLNQLSRVV